MPLFAAFLPLDFSGWITAAEVSFCLIALSRALEASGSLVSVSSVFVHLTDAFLSLEAFLV